MKNKVYSFGGNTSMNTDKPTINRSNSINRSNRTIRPNSTNKLTETIVSIETVDEIPNYINFIAMDENHKWCGFASIPYRLMSFGEWRDSKDKKHRYNLPHLKMSNGKDWKATMFQRSENNKWVNANIDKVAIDTWDKSNAEIRKSRTFLKIQEKKNNALLVNGLPVKDIFSVLDIKYIAMDSDGSWYGYLTTPVCRTQCSVWRATKGMAYYAVDSEQLNIKPFNSSKWCLTLFKKSGKNLVQITETGTSPISHKVTKPPVQKTKTDKAVIPTVSTVPTEIKHILRSIGSAKIVISNIRSIKYNEGVYTVTIKDEQYTYTSKQLESFDPIISVMLSKEQKIETTNISKLIQLIAVDGGECTLGSDGWYDIKIADVEPHIKIQLPLKPVYKYLAMGKSGQWGAFINKPTITNILGEDYWFDEKDAEFTLDAFDLGIDHAGWENSLHEYIPETKKWVRIK